MIQMKHLNDLSWTCQFTCQFHVIVLNYMMQAMLIRIALKG